MQNCPFAASSLLLASVLLLVLGRLCFFVCMHVEDFSSELNSPPSRSSPEPVESPLDALLCCKNRLLPTFSARAWAVLYRPQGFCARGGKLAYVGRGDRLLFLA